MNALTNWKTDITSNLVVTGQTEDGEDILREVFRVACVNSFGDRYESVFSSFNRSDVARFRNRVVLALHYDKADPSKSPRWFRGNPVYGSAAYTKYGQADEVAWEKSCG